MRSARDIEAAVARVAYVLRSSDRDHAVALAIARGGRVVSNEQAVGARGGYGERAAGLVKGTGVTDVHRGRSKRSAGEVDRAGSSVSCAKRHSSGGGGVASRLVIDADAEGADEEVIAHFE